VKRRLAAAFAPASLAVLALAAAMALAPGARAHESHRKHAPQPGVHSLDVYRDGAAIHLLTGEIRGGAHTLWHRRSLDEGRSWSVPARVDAGLAPARHFKRGDDAQIAASGERVVAIWSIAGTGWMGSGPFAAAVSADGGKTWRAARTPADTGATTGHGFADLLFAPDGLHAAWLDSRDKAQGLRAARSRDFGESWEANVSVARGTCECCWNTLHQSQGRLRVLYRGKGPRDMALAETRDGVAWQRKGRVGAFDWEFKGCPETGGGLAQTPDGGLHALVWTARDGSQGLHHLATLDGGATWSAPRRLTGKGQHGDLAASGGALAAAWDEIGAIEFAQSNDAGRSWSRARRLAAGDATHPRLVATSTGYLVLWTQREAGTWVLRSREVPR
jgi:hypothetical protein